MCVNISLYTSIKFWLSSLELLALLLAAAIHDVDHPGTTNTFQMNTLLVFVNDVMFNERM